MMRQPTRITLAVLTAMVLTALTGASTASATTLEMGGVAQNAEVAIEMSIAPGASFVATDTAGTIANICTASTMKGHTSSPFTAAGTGAIGGPIAILEWNGCTEGNPTVDSAGTLSVTWIKGTTNGTVSSNGLKTTIPSLFGTLTCTTSNTDIGTITGVSLGSATFDIKAVISCTVVVDTKWSGMYTVTSPAGLGVTE